MKPAEAVLDPLTGCWLWHGPKTDGYGTISIHGRKFLVHRMIWEVERARLPAGVQLDHLCRRRNCCRPAHLEPVTNRENNRRVFPRHRRAMTLCPENHLLAETGIDTPEGGRVCRLCSGVPDEPPPYNGPPIQPA